MQIEISKDSGFSIHNLPYGIFNTEGSKPRVGMAIGDYIIDLVELSKSGIIDTDPHVLEQPFLNDLIALGKPITNKLRRKVQAWIKSDSSPLGNQTKVFIKQSDATMHLPIKVGDYTDFYSSIEHATNVGAMFRDPENALLPNWKHLPVGYHGRASSIIVSGHDIHRPYGQTMPKGAEVPMYGPSKRLDFELEMAFVVGKPTVLGDQVTMGNAHEHIFGMVLFNDWSARDIQKWEYVPLGPFLGKSFASSISPWVVTMEALEPFKVAGPVQTPEVFPYLSKQSEANYDIALEVGLTPKEGAYNVISQSNYKYMYWNMHQQLAHHTVNGCNVNVGDLMASGTISGKDETAYGSMLELSWGGKKTLELKDGITRKFIEDYDTISLKGVAEKDGIKVGFGEVTAQILPAK